MSHRPAHSPARSDCFDAVFMDTSWGVRIEVLRTLYRTQRFSRHFHDTFTIASAFAGTVRLGTVGGTIFVAPVTS